MMFKSHFGETVTVVLAIVMGIIMSLTAIIVDHLEFNFSNVFKIWGMVTLVILLVSIVVPYKAWSVRLTSIWLREGSIPYLIVENILPSLILNTCNTVVVSAANILYNEAIPAHEQISVWAQGILHDWPITFVVSYISAFFAGAIGELVAKRFCVRT